MLRVARHRRVFALLWAVLQFALPAFGALAEAGYAAASSPASLAHVEDRSGPGCRPVHAPDCALCQALSTHATAVPAPAVDWTWSAVIAAPPLAERAYDDAIALRTHPPARAPPFLS